MKSTNHKRMLLIAIFIAAVGSSGIYHQQNQDNEGLKATIELASKESAARQTVLGKAKKVQKKQNKEYNIQLVDPAMKQKWGLAMTNAEEAWKRHRNLGSRKIVVAVIDTGIDIHHPDLKNNLWINEAEKNGKANYDDDGNGYKDDVYGYNFVGDNGDLTDNHGHGTHIAGIIGAEGGNGIGVSGLAPRVSLMALKYYDPKAAGRNNLMNTVKALKYAVDMNVDIINYSGGGAEQSAAEKKLLLEAERKGILVVAAAGNEQNNSDIHAYYPADYEMENIISVTAVDQGKNILPTSNYGKISVDIAAPGNNIYSTLPGGSYGYMTGTSQATAFVSGLAVLLKAQYKDFDAIKIVRHIKETGDWDPRLIGKTRHQKRINTYRALAIKDNNVGRTDVVADNESNLDSSFYTTGRDAAAVPAGTTTAVRDLNGLSEISQAIQQKIKKQGGSKAIKGPRL